MGSTLDPFYSYQYNFEFEKSSRGMIRFGSYFSVQKYNFTYLYFVSLAMRCVLTGLVVHRLLHLLCKVFRVIIHFNNWYKIRIKTHNINSKKFSNQTLLKLWQNGISKIKITKALKAMFGKNDPLGCYCWKIKSSWFCLIQNN